MDRRQFCVTSAVLVTAVGFPALAAPRRPRARVIIDNDFSGDPDGLFQLAHHLLSPSVEIPMIIGSHIHENDFLDGSETQAENAVERVNSLLETMRIEEKPDVLTGRNFAGIAQTELSNRIIQEAQRSDTDVPLVYACGAGLTELAAALRAAPHIGKNMRLVWIGGPEWSDTPLHVPPRGEWEYNFHINAEATQFVFNETDIEIWQVPRQTYRQMMVSMSELRARLRLAGPLGKFLMRSLDEVRQRWDDHMGETFILGDNPLVTLTALLSSFEPDTSSSEYVVRPTPNVDNIGRYQARPDSRPMRIYTRIDTRLTFADMFSKFSEQYP